MELSTDPVERMMGFAPPEPPEWFVPVMATPRPAMPVAPEHIASMVERRTTPTEVLDAEKSAALAAYYHLEDEARDAGRAWDALQAQEKLLQWPAWWAGEVLRRREAMKNAND